MPNYEKEMQRVLTEVEPGTPLLLHACCAPCSTVALEKLNEVFAVTLYYYNPNIAPLDEYEQRRRTLQRLVLAVPARQTLKLEQGMWDHDTFLEEVRGLEDEPEGGARCEVCIRMRLRGAAKQAQRMGIEWFGTTLSTGPRKNAALLWRLGSEVAKEYGLRFLPADFKKKDGYKRSIELSQQYRLYRQDYCGCEFSARD